MPPASTLKGDQSPSKPLQLTSVIPELYEQNRSLHRCAQDVQITHMANNMVNIYNISLDDKLESLQNDSWVQKKDYRVLWKSKCG
jgi:hypothetical protein